MDWILSHEPFAICYDRRYKIITFSFASGVSQGSHLGPLLFLMFIWDIPNCIKNARCLMYANDIKLFFPIKNILDTSVLQRVLNELCLWCRNNHLHLNISKCKTMPHYRTRNPALFDYQINYIYLERVTLIKNLGILFDQKLSFIDHMSYITSTRMSSSLLEFVFRTCRDFNDVHLFKVLYYANVCSHLKYGCIIWYPSYSLYITRIKSCQKRFLQHVFNKFGYLQ